MKLVHMASGLAVAIALAACADKSADIQTPAPAANTSISATQQPAIQQPNVSGTVWIRQKVALPPDAVLTVTLSDASLADAPSKVLAQKAFEAGNRYAQGMDRLGTGMHHEPDHGRSTWRRYRNGFRS